MMYFAHSLTTYSPKNRKNKELLEFIASREDILLPSEIDKDAFFEEIRNKVTYLNAKYPKVKEIKVTHSRYDIRASVRDNSGCPDEIFILRITRVRSTYRFTESQLIPEGGRNDE